MKNLLQHTHTSILRMLSDLSVELSSEIGQTFTVVNFDSVTDEVDLPPGHVIGLEDFSYTENDDPVSMTSFQLVVATENDANNMTLIQSLSFLVDKTKALKAFNLLDTNTGETIGSLLCIGPRRVPPKFSGETKTFQGILINMGVQPDF